MSFITTPTKIFNAMQICIIGCIGLGKSSLTKALAEVIKEKEGFCEALYEPASKTNPYLADYYADPSRYGFPIQIFLLNKRFESQLYAQSLVSVGKSVVQDSCLFSDCAFVEMLSKYPVKTKEGIEEIIFTERERKTYLELFSNMARSCLYPTTIIKLEGSVETAQKRIIKRMTEKSGRKCESGITNDYLKNLISEIDDLSDYLSIYCNVIKLNWDKELTKEELKEKAEDVYNKIKTLEPIPCQLGQF